MQNLDLKDHLEQRGYLTLHQLEMYLKQYYPTKAVSGPTLRRYLDYGYFKYDVVHKQFRVERDSIARYCEHGTEGANAPPPPSPSIKDPNQDNDVGNLIIPVETIEDGSKW